jgi:hypothetical protein
MMRDKRQCGKKLLICQANSIRVIPAEAVSRGIQNMLFAGLELDSGVKPAMTEFGNSWYSCYSGPDRIDID